MNPEAVPLTRHIGRCVYCGSTDNLTDEHIVPHGLKGPWQLLKGSCNAYNQITSAFERSVLQEQFILPRVALDLPTYHPKNRPQKFSFEVEKGGRKEKIVLPVTDCPPIFMMLDLEKPRYIANYDYEKGVMVKGCSLHGPSQAKLKEKLSIEGISLTTSFAGNCFERVLAKIAYGMIILAYGSDALEECYVLPCILGQKDDVGYWVGSSGKDYRILPPEKALHRIFLTVNGKEVGALIRLFANYQTPEYLVIVGKLKQV
ncbi:HNH endonuclease [Chloroflexota bacterium]